MSRHHGSFPRTKNGRGLSKMTLDLTPMKMSRKSTTEGGVDFVTRPRRWNDGQEGRGSSKMIHTREAILGEEVRTSLKTERSTREAGDPRSKMKSTRVSLSLTFRSAFLAPIVGFSVTTHVRLAIVITVEVFNLRFFREG